MKQMIKEKWRQPMWDAMMNSLPATITINLKTQSYVVKDNSQKCIFADDIDESGVDEIIQELAEQLNFTSGCEFQEVFSMRRLMEAWNGDQKGYSLLSRMDGSEITILKTDVIFGQGSRELIAELRFDLFDGNSQLFARI